MLNDYVYCANMYPSISFDARFAKKYGIAEAIIFNSLYYHDSQIRGSKAWKRNDGIMQENGQIWVGHRVESLTSGISAIFDKQHCEAAIEHLCDAGLLYVRPSVTDGYCWVRIGEERGEDSERETN